MAQVTRTEVPAAERAAAAPAEAHRADLERAVRLGLLAGLIMVFISAIGMVVAFSGRVLVQPFLTMSYAALYLVPFGLGYVAGKPPEELEGLAPVTTGPRNVLAGLLTGAIGGAVTGVFMVLATVFDFRSIFVNVSPALIQILAFGREIAPATALVTVLSAALGTAGAAIAILPERVRRSLMAALLWTLAIGLLEGMFAQLIRGIRLDAINRFLYSPRGGLTPGGAVTVALVLFGVYVLLEPRRRQVRATVEAMPERQRRTLALLATAALVLALAILPRIIGSFNAEVLDLVGIFLLMGLGLNIVVGYAGLLDLGYVAFFAVGAYMTAVLTSPSSPRWSPELTFWTALPFVVLAAAVAGILVGTPVLRMRGDYLAIVTLGFGEIARIVANSQWMAPYLGGAQGVLSIPKISIAGWEARTPPDLFYPIVVFVLLTIYVSWALQDSRTGRAWMAMREDEPVAEVIGIDIVKAKLSAFVLGAILASFGGAIFATKIGAIFPHSFSILVSITVLVLIIVGGMGSIPGVIVGALVLVGLPELLREFNEFRLLLYGVLLIYMMLNKPEGFIPSRQRVRELHQEEMLQDAWVLQEREQQEREAPATARDRDPDAGLT